MRFFYFIRGTTLEFYTFLNFDVVKHLLVWLFFLTKALLGVSSVYSLRVADFASVVGGRREANAAFSLVLTVRTRVRLRAITCVWGNTFTSILAGRNTDSWKI